MLHHRTAKPGNLTETGLFFLPLKLTSPAVFGMFKGLFFFILLSIRNSLRSALRTLVQIVLISAAVSSSVSAQSYSFQHYSSAEGLELSSVNTIFQDSRGSLWFGGVGGAFRFDGEQFIPYLSSGPRRSVVTRFAEDRSGSLWIATEGNGVAKVRYGVKDSVEWFRQSHSFLPSDSVYSIVCGKNGTTVFGTRRGAAVVTEQGSVTIISSANGLKGNWIRFMLHDAEGRLLISTNGGVTRFTMDGVRIVSSEFIHDAAVLAMSMTPDGTVLLGTTEGRLEPNKGVFALRNDSLARVIDLRGFSDPIKTQSLLTDSRGALWVGTGGGGIILREHGRTTRIRTAQGLVNESIGSILEDRDGSLWFATANGVMKLPRRYTLKYSEQQRISGILTVLADRSDNIWCGGYRSITRIDADGRIHDLTGEPLLKDMACFSIVQDSGGTIWLGTNGRLLSYNDGRFSRIQIQRGTAQEYIYALTADAREGVWVGRKGAIFHLVNGRVVQRYDSADGIPDEDIAAIASDRSGRIWFTAGNDWNGIIERGTVRRIVPQAGSPAPNTDLIKEDTRGRMWFISKAGVSYSLDGVFTAMAQEAFPLENNMITAFHEDNERHLWFGTWFGLVEWSDSVIARYDTRDGLSGDIVQSIAEDRSGNLWIGTRGGLTKFPHTERISYIPIPPLTLERIRDDKHETVVSSFHTVPYDERIVTFRAGSVSYFDEQNMEFQFRLSGFETDWNPPTRMRTIRYTTLPSGEYTLTVRARNRNGAWTEPVQYAFTILPPFWKTWWFTTSAALLFLGIASGFVRQRFLRLRKEAESQEHFSKQLMDVYETERKRIASELHDGLGQNLLIIANRAKMGLRKEGAEAMQREFEIISSSALESIGDVRKITYNLHPLQIEEVGLTAAVESMLKRIAHVGDRTVSFTVDPIDELIPKEHAIHFYRSVQEVLNNAVKHADASAVEVTIVQDEDSLRAIVRDNGKGFDPKEKKDGYGMRSLNERVKILGGTYHIDSAPGAGTIIKIDIPIRTRTS